jgi:hypothetical protein
MHNPSLHHYHQHFLLNGSFRWCGRACIELKQKIEEKKVASSNPIEKTRQTTNILKKTNPMKSKENVLETFHP